MSTSDAVEQRQLTPDQWAVVNATEQLFYIDNDIPKVERVAELSGTSTRYVTESFKDPLVIESLTFRGINITASSELLSTEQLAALAVFFDTKDGRSLKKKLSDIGIATGTWEGWKKDPTFAAHFRARAEQSLQSNLAETEVALMDSAHRGDISAIKLHLELAGRWSSKTVGELNVDFLLMKILEAAQKTIRNPDDLTAFANEVMALSPTPQPALNPAGTVQQLAL